jgi:urease accessory protein
MRSTAAVVAEPGEGGHGRPRLTEMRSSAPLALRWADGCLFVVGSAFAPLGGDELTLEVTVAADASLTVRTVAASVALPSRSGAPSRFTVRVSVATGGRLEWLPEPGVAAAGCCHVNDAQLDLADGAELVWREEVLLGRHGEAGGEWRSLLGATQAGRPLLDQDTAVGGPSWGSPAVGWGARAAGSLLVVGPDAPTDPVVSRVPVPPTGASVGAAAHAAVLPLVSRGVWPAALTSAVAPDARTLRQLVTPS